MGSKKSIPNNIGDYIDELAFAVIFGDDAKIKHASGYYELCLQSYSPAELAILNEAINTKLGLNGRVVTHEVPGRYIIRYPVSDSTRIGDIVSKHLPTCMHFKLLKTDTRHIPLATGAGLPLPLRGDRAVWRAWYQTVKSDTSLGDTMGYLEWLKHNSSHSQDPAYLYNVELNTIKLDGIELCELPGDSGDSGNSGDAKSL